MVPGFDPDLLAKSSLFLLCYTLSFEGTIKRYIAAAFREYLIKKRLTEKPFSCDISIIFGDMFMHLSQNLQLVREALEGL